MSRGAGGRLRSIKKYKAKMVAAGNCAICGKPRGKSPYKTLCLYHALRKRIMERSSGEHKPWRKRGDGRPPLELPVRELDQLERMRREGQL